MALEPSLVRLSTLAFDGQLRAHADISLLKAGRRDRCRRDAIAHRQAIHAHLRSGRLFRVGERSEKSKARAKLDRKIERCVKALAKAEAARDRGAPLPPKDRGTLGALSGWNVKVNGLKAELEEFRTRRAEL
jgi:hypothetical protein